MKRHHYSVRWAQASPTRKTDMQDMIHFSGKSLFTLKPSEQLTDTILIIVFLCDPRPRQIYDGCWFNDFFLEHLQVKT